MLPPREANLPVGIKFEELIVIDEPRYELLQPRGLTLNDLTKLERVGGIEPPSNRLLKNSRKAPCRATNESRWMQS